MYSEQDFILIDLIVKFIVFFFALGFSIVYIEHQIDLFLNKKKLGSTIFSNAAFIAFCILWSIFYILHQK